LTNGKNKHAVARKNKTSSPMVDESGWGRKQGKGVQIRVTGKKKENVGNGTWKRVDLVKRVE